MHHLESQTLSLRLPRRRLPTLLQHLRQRSPSVRRATHAWLTGHRSSRRGASGSLRLRTSGRLRGEQAIERPWATRCRCRCDACRTMLTVGGHWHCGDVAMLLLRGLSHHFLHSRIRVRRRLIGLAFFDANVIVLSLSCGTHPVTSNCARFRTGFLFYVLKQKAIFLVNGRSGSACGFIQ